MYPVSKTKDLGILGVIGIVGASPSKIFFIENPKQIKKERVLVQNCGR